MDEKELKRYFGFYNAIWDHTRKYHTGLNSTNFWQSYLDERDIIQNYPEVHNRQNILNEVQWSLWRIGGHPDWSESRCDSVFEVCKNYGKEYVPILMHWIDWQTRNDLEHIDYILFKLSELLKHFGHNYTPEQLEAFAEGGWLIRI